jgi:ABC-type transporter Mla subunit MlaD
MTIRLEHSHSDPEIQQLLDHSARLTYAAMWLSADMDALCRHLRDLQAETQALIKETTNWLKDIVEKTKALRGLLASAQTPPRATCLGGMYRCLHPLDMARR